jgi:chromate transporter
VLAAAWRIGSRTLKNSWLIAIAIASFAAIAIGEIPFPMIVIAQGAVDTFHWLLPTQMIDGLAL